MPRGEEKVSTKDPRAAGKQSFEKTSDTVQRQCREQIRKLQLSISREEDKSICKYFGGKWDTLFQKVDKYYFRTVEEYRFELNYIFKKFDIQVKKFYDFYHRSCENGTFPLYENCLISSEEQEATEQSESHYNLLDQDITEVLYTLKRAESGVEHCVKSLTKEKEDRARILIEIFADAANRLKLKIKNKDLGISEMSEDEIDNGENQEAGYTYSYAQQSSGAEDSESQEYEDSTMLQSEHDAYDEQVEDSYSKSPDWKKPRMDSANDPNDSPESSQAEDDNEAEAEAEIEAESDAEAKAVPNHSMLWADLELTSSAESNESDSQ